MKRKRILLAVVLGVSMLLGCSETAPKKSNDLDFQEYIDAYALKEISVQAAIKVRLKKPIADNGVSTLLQKELFSISPKVKGTLKLENNQELSFVPAKKLAVHTEYAITLHLSKLYPNIKNSLKDFHFNIKTKALAFSVETFDVQSYDKEWQYIEGVLNASDVVEMAALKKVVSAKHSGVIKNIQFNSAHEFSKNVSFKIDSIQRLQDDSEVALTWNGQEMDSKSAGSQEIKIAGRNNFKVIGIKTTHTANRSIEINFSDPLDRNQNLKGLVVLSNTKQEDVRLVIHGNTLSIYPKLTGDKAYQLEVFKGIKNNEGHQLKETVTKEIYFEQLKPSLNFVKSGVILPDSKNLKINFQSANLRAVDVLISKIYKNNILQFLQRNELDGENQLRFVSRPFKKQTINLQREHLDLSKKNAFAIDLATMIKPEEGAMYRVELSFNKAYSYYECEGKKNEKDIVFGAKDIDNKPFNNLHYYSNYYPDNFNWNERSNPCSDSYYVGKSISTSILASNLGVILKKGTAANLFVAVTNILTTQPIKGATVDLYNLQKQKIASQKTDKTGVSRFAKNEAAYFVVVSKGAMRSYVKLEDARALSMSKFDVSGAKTSQGIKGYIYGERGVWRPGDAMFLTFVLNDNANKIADNHPIKFELLNPNGKIVTREVQQKNNKNVYSFKTKTNDNALTGTWKLHVKVGNVSFSKQLKVETIKPNRLKIKASFKEAVFRANAPIEGSMAVTWLHGAIAKNLKIDIQGKFRQTKTSFSNFKKFHFDDISRPFSTEEYTIMDGKLNDKGVVGFSLKPSFKGKAPGMLKAAFITKVYENGGDFSTDVFTKKIAPYERYVGLRAPEEKVGTEYLYTDKEYAFDVAAVNEFGEGVSLNNVAVNIYKLSWKWWWNTSEENLSYYSGSALKEVYEQQTIKTAKSGKGVFKFKVSENDWGRYLIRISDKKGGHSSSKIVYFDWPAWSSRQKKNQDPTAASMLVFTSDKNEYQVDEKVKIRFPSTEGARALITIENGTKVLENFWVNTSNKETVFEFPVLKSYAPNVFVNISLLQKHHETKNDLPIRMYGSIPISVIDAATILKPEISFPDTVRPEETVVLSVSEAAKKEMTYTIAIVDEGLLDLTRFKTPNPWNRFYSKQSLGVKTWDVYDDVIGAYGGKINQILSIGGDETEAGSKNKKANRFKPAVRYLGPFVLKKGKVKKHKITIPKYIGSVRLMVVASNNDTESYGKIEKTVTVKKPLMLLASLPRKITPKEKVRLPVTVFSMDKGIKEVTVSLKKHPAFKILGAKAQTVLFNEPEEKMVYFDLEINDYNGIAQVKVLATAKQEKASYDVEVDVFNPNPVTTELQEVFLQENESKTFEISQFGTKGTNSAFLESSILPSMNFSQRLSYLIQYPHGCVEQTTSSAFPQLFLSDIFNLSASKRTAIEKNVKAAIEKLADFQLPSGGLSYWQGGNSVSDWGTTYAGHFLFEAEKKGYVLPINFKYHWIQYQKKKARNWRFGNSNYANNDIGQAYRLFVLAYVNNADIASMNRMREIKELSNAAKMRLAAAYGQLGKIEVAKLIFESISFEKTKVNTYGFGSKIRNKAMELETTIVLGENEQAYKLVKEIAASLRSTAWMSTQSTAYSLLALSKYITKNKPSKELQLHYVLNGKKSVVSSAKSIVTTELKPYKKKNTIKVTNSQKGGVFVRVYSKGVLPIGEEKAIQRNLKVTKRYASKNGLEISPLKLAQGTNFLAEIQIENTSIRSVENIALTEYLPSGWEIINTRYTDFGAATKSNDLDFVDIRDDRVNYYFSLKGKEKKTITLLLNASYLGKYYLPGIQCEAMYDHDYFVRGTGKWVEITK